MSKHITIKQPVKGVRNWTIFDCGINIGRIVVHADGDWTGRVGTMNEDHFNAALELVAAEIAEEELLKQDDEVQ